MFLILGSVEASAVSAIVRGSHTVVENAEWAFRRTVKLAGAPASECGKAL